MNPTLQKVKILNGFQLKWIAIITMTIDHAGAILFPQYIWMRMVGRLAFPIFAFLIVQGMTYTRNVNHYLIRLGIFALISEIPFDWAFHDSVLYLESQNIFFTLLIGAGCIYIYQKYESRGSALIGVVALSFVAEFLCTDYGMVGVWLIFALYCAKGNLLYTLGVLLIFNVGLWGGVQMYGALAFIPILLSNEEKGKGGKYFFYIYYPAHILLLKCILMLGIL